LEPSLFWRPEEGPTPANQLQGTVPWLCTYSASCLGEDLWEGRAAEGELLEARLAAAWIAVLGGSRGRLQIWGDVGGAGKPDGCASHLHQCSGDQAKMEKFCSPGSWEVSRRVAVPYRVLVAGAVGMFLLGANLTMLVLLQTGWIGANSPAFDPGLRAIAPTPTLWCPDHGGDHAGWMAKTLASHEPGLVIDVGAYDGKEAIAMARAGHRVLSFEPTPNKAKKIREAIKEAGLEVRAPAIPLPW